MCANSQSNMYKLLYSFQEVLEHFREIKSLLYSILIMLAMANPSSLCFHKPIDLSHSAAMLSLRRIKSFGFARKASPTREFSARLAVQKQNFLFS